MVYLLLFGLFLLVFWVVYVYRKSQEKALHNRKISWKLQWPERQQNGIIKDLEEGKIHSSIVKLEQRIYDLENQKGV